MNEQIVRGVLTLTTLKPSTIEITANGEYDVTKHTIASVNVPIPEGYIKPSGTLTANRVGYYNVRDYAFANFNVPTESKVFTPTKEYQSYQPTNSYITSVVVNPIPSEYIIPSGTLEINANGIFDVTQYAYVSVDAKKNEQTKRATPTKEEQTILPDKDMVLSAVYIDAIPSEYVVPSGTLDITSNDTYDVTEVKNVIVNVPIPDGYLKPEGELKITENNKYEIGKYKYVNVEIQTGINITDATATPSDVLKGKIAYNNNGKIEGTIEEYDGSNSDMTAPLVSVMKQYLDLKKSAYQLFQYYTGESVALSYNDTENVTDMSYMFSNCVNLQSIPLLNTSNVTVMRDMFQGCVNLTTIPQLDTSKATTMYNMFRECTLLTTIPQLNTSNVTTMQSMFNGCKVLTSIPPLDVRNVTSFTNTFLQCIKMKRVLMYGMKASFRFNASTLFEASDLVTIISNCQVVTSSSTLTMGSTNLAKLENVYVKETGVELYEGITCRPCVICESTDEGAMLVTTYATNKGWTLA